MSNIGNVLINTALSVVSAIIKMLLLPVDYVVQRFLPDVNSLISYINNFIDLCLSCVGWFIDAIGIPPLAIQLIISYFVLKYTLYLFVYLLKIALSWFRRLV